MFRYVKRMLSSNCYFLLGILIGLYFSTLLSKKGCSEEFDASASPLASEISLKRSSNVYTLVKPNATLRPSSPSSSSPAKKTKLIRPRYYSTELGIRQKLFVGILSSEENVNSQILHINSTIGHLVDKLKFFITAQYKLKTKFNLTGLVGFTDTRHRYRPFQVIKYIGDSFLQDYDFYFLTNDHSFINARRLKDIINKISVSMDVYLGTRVPESSYCNLDAGILLSNSVLKVMHQHLESCVVNTVSDDHSENIGRCVYEGVRINCQETVLVCKQKLSSYRIKHFVLKEYLKELSNEADFNRAVTITPVLQGSDFYLLNAYFAKQRLKQLNLENKHLSSDLTESWPPGQRIGAKPLTRFDAPRQIYFNMTHTFFPDDFTNVMEHSKSDLNDIKNVIGTVKAKMLLQERDRLQFRRLVNGYRTFDLSRGMDYKLDLGFRDLKSGKEIVKRFEVCKPLGKLEFIPAPYVTENTRVTIFLPVQETEKDLALDFIRTYSKNIMEQREKTFLMLVLLYQYESSSKSKDDVFYDIKNITLRLSNIHHSEDTKVAWVSIRLPKNNYFLYLENCSPLNYAVIDLGLKKIGLESLVLLADVNSIFTVDFLNRVRMNTIQGYQVFNPIPFRQYDPKITQIQKIEVNKNVGHFDNEEYKYISFYTRDYVKARKKSQHLIPLIKSDNDILRLLSQNVTKMSVFEMFLKYSENIHCMRATEMSLKVKYYDLERCERTNYFYGNKLQLAKLLLRNKDLVGHI